MYPPIQYIGYAEIILSFLKISSISIPVLVFPIYLLFFIFTLLLKASFTESITCCGVHSFGKNVDLGPFGTPLIPTLA